MLTTQRNIHTLATIFFVLAISTLVFAPMIAYAGSPTPPQLGGTADAQPRASEIGISTRIGSMIGNFILYIGSYITGFGGKLLDSSINMFVVNIATLLNGAGLGTAINNVWVLIRDICNLAFIFGFIYVGIRTIIDADSSSTKRMLASIIIGALLINFSLFIAKAIIDVSNRISVEIYNSMVTSGGNGSIARSFENRLGLSTIYNVENVREFSIPTTGGNFAFFFMATLLLIIAGFVFAAGAIFLIIRFVALVLILCFSPILFAATVFPATKAYADNLWRQLISYAFFAPVYLLLLIVSLNVLGGVMTSIRGSRSMASALVGVSGTGAADGTVNDAYGIFLSFGVAIFFLIMSLQIASKFGIHAADKVIGFGNTLRGHGQRMLMRGAGAATFGTAGAVGRATAGRAANYLSEKDGLKDAAARRGIRGWAARQTLKGSRVVADSSFDARKVAGVGATLGIGEGAKGGYQTKLKEVEEKESKFAKSLGEVGDDDVRVTARKKEMTEEERQLRLMDEQLRQARQQGANPQVLAQMRDAIEDQKKKIDDAKIALEKEKQRRVIGSTYAKPRQQDEAELNRLKDAVSNPNNGLKVQVKNAWANYVALNNEAAKEAARPGIEALMKQLADAESEYKKLLTKQPDRGYASTLENSKFFTAWPIGRLVAQEKNAGEEIRKTAEKGLPKKKDD